LVLANIAGTAITTDDDPIRPPIKKEVKGDGVIRPNGTIKLRRPAPKHNKPGNLRDGSVIDGESRQDVLSFLGGRVWC
jgi:SAGA-associated factor 73